MRTGNRRVPGFQPFQCGRNPLISCVVLAMWAAMAHPTHAGVAVAVANLPASARAIAGAGDGPETIFDRQDGPTLEIVQHTLTDPTTYLRPATDAVVAAFTLTARNYPIRLHSLVLSSTGSGDERRDVGWAQIVEDTNADGHPGEGEPLIASRTRPFPADNGQPFAAEQSVEVAPLHPERAYPGAAEVNGRIYAVGGVDVSGGDVLWLDRVDAYDPRTNRWEQKASMPTARSAPICVALDGRIYVIGGLGDERESVANEVYDPEQDTWVTKAPMPTGRALAGGAVVNGRIYVIGGFDYSPFDFLDVVEEYDPVSNTWTAKTPIPERGRVHACGTIGDEVYVALTGGGPAAFAIYDPDSDSWRLVGANRPLLEFNDSGIAYRERMYRFGSGSWDPTVNEFSPETGEVISLAPLRLAHQDPGLAAYHDQVFVIGGFGAVNVLTACVEAYSPRALTLDRTLAVGESVSYVVSYDFVNRSAPASTFQLVIEEVVASASAPVTVTGVTTSPLILLEQGHGPATLKLR